MKLLINYANNVFRKSQTLNSITGKKIASFDKVISYSPKDIEAGFYKKNRKILDCKIGNGYWLWKPYFIKKSLEILTEGDFLFYCDSGAYFIEQITPFIDICRETGQEIIPFELLHKEKIWTKRDAFILLDCDTPEYTDSRQFLSSFILFKKSKFTVKFANEYLHYSQDERLITDLDNTCGYPNYPGFIAHRHVQSIFSILIKKYALEGYRDPSQWGNGVKESYTNSKYGQLIEHTRRRHEPILAKIAQKIKIPFIRGDK
jgi:hypothetical protein